MWMWESLRDGQRGFARCVTIRGGPAGRQAPTPVETDARRANEVRQATGGKSSPRLAVLLAERGESSLRRAGRPILRGQRRLLPAHRAPRLQPRGRAVVPGA